MPMESAISSTFLDSRPLFASDVWKGALESYASATRLSVELFDTQARVALCVRALVFDALKAAPPSDRREIAVIEFEIDDQSAEDLATGLERLREHDGIVDVVQMPVFGKKGRVTTSVRALARTEALDEAVAACFRETTTIGLRHRIVSRAELPRRVTTVEVQGRPVRVKTVERPGGATAKAEADDATALDGHAARAGLRREAERLALSLDEERS
jgi:pyridinium-3,5-bisthiocarboxylic acid mononucleotide nickel chelatase